MTRDRGLLNSRPHSATSRMPEANDEASSAGGRGTLGRQTTERPEPSDRALRVSDPGACGHQWSPRILGCLVRIHHPCCGLRGCR
jgi:hypothetical protein